MYRKDYCTTHGIRVGISIRVGSSSGGISKMSVYIKVSRFHGKVLSGKLSCLWSGVIFTWFGKIFISVCQPNYNMYMKIAGTLIASGLSSLIQIFFLIFIVCTLHTKW